MPDGCEPLGLQGGDGGADGSPDPGVHALDLPQPGDVLGCGDGGVRPQGHQGDDRHHEEADDPCAHGAGPQAPAPRARGRRAGCLVRGPFRALVRRWSGVRATAARGWLERRPAACSGHGTDGAGTGWTHGFLVRDVGALSSGPDARIRRYGAVVPVGWFGRAGADAPGPPAVGDSATKAEVRKR